MAILNPEPELIYQEAVQGGAAVSESLLALVGSTSNFLLYNFAVYPFGVSGGVFSGLATPYTFTGTIESMLYKCTIEKVWVFCEETGTSGTTSFRIEKQLAAGGAWSTIFGTNCSITSAAADGVNFLSSDLVAPTGVTLPTLSVTSMELGDKLRWVLVTSANQASNLQIRVITRPVT